MFVPYMSFLLVFSFSCSFMVVSISRSFCLVVPFVWLFIWALFFVRSCFLLALFWFQPRLFLWGFLPFSGFFFVFLYSGLCLIFLHSNRSPWLGFLHSGRCPRLILLFSCSSFCWFFAFDFPLFFVVRFWLFFLLFRVFLALSFRCSFEGLSFRCSFQFRLFSDFLFRFFVA